MKSLMPTSLTAICCVLVTFNPAFAAPFDGTWSVTQDCQAAPDGARPFKWSYDAIVKDGVLTGQYGTKGKPASLTLTGTIQPDGTSQLAARGLNGSSEHTVGFLKPGDSFYYTVQAQFTSTTGTGSRTSGRTCIFSFVKH